MDYWHRSAGTSRTELTRKSKISCRYMGIMDTLVPKQLMWYNHLQRMEWSLGMDTRWKTEDVMSKEIMEY